MSISIWLENLIKKTHLFLNSYWVHVTIRDALMILIECIPQSILSLQCLSINLRCLWLLQADSPILGLIEAGEGRIAVYGDSNCLDSSHMVTNCYWLLRKILDFTSMDKRDPVLFSDSRRQDKPLSEDDYQLPTRRTDVNFSTYSSVVGKDLICRTDSRFEVWGTKGHTSSTGTNRRQPGHLVTEFGKHFNSTMDASNSRRPKYTQSSTSDNNLRSKYLGILYRDEVGNQILIGCVVFFYKMNICILLLLPSAKDCILQLQFAAWYACASCQPLACTCSGCSYWWVPISSGLNLCADTLWC